MIVRYHGPTNGNLPTHMDRSHKTIVKYYFYRPTHNTVVLCKLTKQKIRPMFRWTTITLQACLAAFSFYLLRSCIMYVYGSSTITKQTIGQDTVWTLRHCVITDQNAISMFAYCDKVKLQLHSAHNQLAYWNLGLKNNRTKKLIKMLLS